MLGELRVFGHGTVIPVYRVVLCRNPGYPFWKRDEQKALWLLTIWHPVVTTPSAAWMAGEVV